MDPEISELYHLIKKWRLDWRHPRELKRVLRRIEKGRLRPGQTRRWLKKVRLWAEDQEKVFIPFGPAPDSQEKVGAIDVEVGSCIENPAVRVGIKLLDKAGRSIVVAGCTGSGKSNLIRKLIYGIDAINRAGGRVHNNPGAGLKG